MKQNRNPLQAYYSHCLKVDLKSAIRALKIDSKNGNSTVLRVRRRVLSRFVRANEKTLVHSDDQFVRELVHLYRNYYRRVLLSPTANKELERQLQGDLRRLLHSCRLEIGARPTWADLERRLAKELTRRGYFSLLGRVSPFRSLLIWSKQVEKKFKVRLVSEKILVTVVLLDKFVELGWLHYATFGRWYVGGWAKKDSLFCVSQAYKRKFNSEAFRVSYLTHEGQHFSDYRKFPNLKQADLEYRAKLAEMIESKKPTRLLNKFGSEAKDDRSTPHCFASHRITEGVKNSKKLNKMHISLNSLSKNMLLAHTQKLKSQGSKTTKGVL
ncbi:MAG: hypothetical protein AABZ06_14830 [Bdellovibrionota bacterium]